MIRRIISRKETNSSNILLIKLMGMGSLIKLVTIFKENNVDFNKITVCTFSQNKEVCELLGFENTIFINKKWNKIITASLLIPFRKGRGFNTVIDAERASSSCSILRKYVALLTNSDSIHFTNKKDIVTGRDIRFCLAGRTHSELFETILPSLKRTTIKSKPLIDTIKNEKASSQVLININASEYLFERRYPMNKYQDIIKYIHKNYPKLSIILTGSRNEYTYVQELYNSLKQYGITTKNTCGKWSLTKLSDELKKTVLFITNDSGPMHLATLSQTQTIAIWGPTHYSHSGYPDNDYLHNISLEMNCSPCFINPTSKIGVTCNGDITCMKNLSTDLVLKKVSEIIDSSRNRNG